MSTVQEISKEIDIRVKIKKSDMLMLKRGKVIKGQQIKLDDGELIK